MSAWGLRVFVFSGKVRKVWFLKPQVNEENCLSFESQRGWGRARNQAQNTWHDQLVVITAIFSEH